MEKSPTLFALFVGINQYHPEAAVAPLHGAVEDARAVEGALVERFAIPARNVVALHDAEATRVAILNAVESHLVARAARWAARHKQGAPPPHFLLYFAGYGAQLITRVQDEAQLLDSLVAYDSRIEGGADILPADLAASFAAIEAHGCGATLILDCGHAAGAHAARAWHPDLRMLGSTWADAPADAQPTTWANCGATVLAAARPREAARERTIVEGGVERGS